MWIDQKENEEKSFNTLLFSYVIYMKAQKTMDLA